jgi:hypothetical protein
MRAAADGRPYPLPRPPSDMMTHPNTGGPDASIVMDYDFRGSGSLAVDRLRIFVI